ncbi:hypothetical protein [Chryseobacterium carnipullorum]|uniref:Uncharacterized protein n=1 Tax=Chryseobacterium carnipullorum TaxID=1124835 RepID=A0A376DR30_CHRCU|nr:hypothetical protein [Chryseobacterium carnipullorum]STC93439.1 Uncharacterised protein [Chryseobacterium carnipullorum]
MINNYFLKGSVIAAFFLQGGLFGQTLIHYWNFNNNASSASITTPSSTLVSGSLAAIPGGTSEIDFAGGTGQNFSDANLNTRNGDPSGTHLRFNNPIGGALQFNLPTTGVSKCCCKIYNQKIGTGRRNPDLVLFNRRNYLCSVSNRPVRRMPVLN